MHKNHWPAQRNNKVFPTPGVYFICRTYHITAYYTFLVQLKPNFKLVWWWLRIPISAFILRFHTSFNPPFCIRTMKKYLQGTSILICLFLTFKMRYYTIRVNLKFLTYPQQPLPWNRKIFVIKYSILRNSKPLYVLRCVWQCWVVQKFKRGEW